MRDLQMGLGLKKETEITMSEQQIPLLIVVEKLLVKRYLDRMNKKGMPPEGGLLSRMNMGGYRDFTDMVDGGGAMARGGDFQGGGLKNI